MSPSHARPGVLVGLDQAHAALILAVDSCPETRGAGIMLVDEGGRRTEVRGGPRRLWVWIAPKGMVPQPVADSHGRESQWDEFKERWGPAMLSCSSAGAAAVVTWLSWGVAAPVTVVLAANSAALCVTSLGKTIAQDAWKEWEREAGLNYQIYITFETFSELVDLFGGTWGALKFLRDWKHAEKLVKLAKAMKGKSGKELLQMIREIDPVEAAVINQKRKKHTTRMKIVGLGERVLAKSEFIGIPNHRKKVLIDGFGNALSAIDAFGFGGARDTYEATLKTGSFLRKQWDVWMVKFDS